MGKPTPVADDMGSADRGCLMPWQGEGSPIPRRGEGFERVLKGRGDLQGVPGSSW